MRKSNIWKPGIWKLFPGEKWIFPVTLLTSRDPCILHPSPCSSCTFRTKPSLLHYMQKLRHVMEKDIKWVQTKEWTRVHVKMFCVLYNFQDGSRNKITCEHSLNLSWELIQTPIKARTCRWAICELWYTQIDANEKNNPDNQHH